MLTNLDLENRFGFHPANTIVQKEAHEQIRVDCLGLAKGINNLVPDCREKSLAISNLEEVMFWANAAAARLSLDSVAYAARKVPKNG